MKKTILFVCTGNTCRSPMAETILKDMAADSKEEYEIISAGTTALAGEPAAGEAVRALEEIGVVMTGHKSQPVTPELLEKVDLIITMTRGHKERILELMPRAGEKTFTLKEFSRKLEGDSQVGKILELDREEARRRQEFQKEKGDEEKRLLARREQLRRDLREVESQLLKLREEKDELLEDIRVERDKLLGEGEKGFDVSDPFGGSLETYQKTRDEIKKELEIIFRGLHGEEN